MTYSYQGPLTYGPQPIPLANDVMQEKKKSSAPYAAAGLVVGGGVGCFAGCRTNPFIAKNGEATDSFSKSVYEKFASKADDAIKKPFEQGNEILKKIDSVKSPDELKTLFNNNPEAAKKVCNELGRTPDEFLSDVTSNNLSSNKKTIKEKLESGNNARFQDMKNRIKTFWDAEKKKFVKPEGSDEKVYNAINEAKKGIKTKVVLKYTAIAGAIGAAAAFIAHKIISHKKEVSQQQNY